eukprot:1328796-Rhodomonas_salina.1
MACWRRTPHTLMLLFSAKSSKTYRVADGVSSDTDVSVSVSVTANCAIASSFKNPSSKFYMGHRMRLGQL